VAKLLSNETKYVHIETTKLSSQGCRQNIFQEGANGKKTEK